MQLSEIICPRLDIIDTAARRVGSGKDDNLADASRARIEVDNGTLVFRTEEIIPAGRNVLDQFFIN